MRSVINFLHDERGSEAVRLVLWTPGLAALLIVVTDASLLYQSHDEMVNVARDTVRRMTTGEIKSEADAIAHAQTALLPYSQSFRVAATYDRTSSMAVQIEVGVTDVSPFGYSLSPLILGDTMQARVVMRSEPI